MSVGHHYESEPVAEKLVYSLVVDEHEADEGKQSPNNSDKLSPRIVGGKGNLCKE